MIVRSPYPELSVPDQELPAFVLSGAAGYPDRAAVIDAASGRRLSYGELRARVRSFAGGLAHLGVRRGDVVAIALPNGPEFPVAFLGAVRAGAACTTLNPVSTAREIAGQLADSGARVVITSAGRLDTFRTAAGPGVRLVAAGEEAPGDAVSFDGLLSAGHPPPEVVIDPAEDLAALSYSSGTTGLPKGVMLTHRNLVANGLQCGPVYDGPGDVALAVAPFFHIMGMAVVMVAGLCRGATLVTMARFDLEQCLRAIAGHRVTSMVVPPPVTAMLARHPLVDGYDLSSLRLLTTGGAPLGAEVQEACARRLGCRTTQAWGMSELGLGTACPPGGTAPGGAGTVGWCVAGTAIQVTDPVTGAEARPGQPGELWFRGPNVMKGYLHNPEATAATLAGDWCRTGDVARVDDSGLITIVDRVKELIKYKGYQVAPAELEAVLLSHPRVADAAVVASPDEEAGEVPKAFLVLKDGRPEDAEGAAREVLEYAAGQVAHYKRVRRYEFVEAIPRTASGKIVRRELTARERAVSPRAITPRG